MSVIARRFWTEPSVCIGVFVSLGLLVLALAADAPLDASVIAGIAAPLVSALGIRQLVSPVQKGGEDDRAT